MERDKCINVQVSNLNKLSGKLDEINENIKKLIEVQKSATTVDANKVDTMIKLFMASLTRFKRDDIAQKNQ